MTIGLLCDIDCSLPAIQDSVKCSSRLNTAQVMTHAVFGSNNALPITIYNSTTSAGSTFILTQTGSCYPVLDVTVQTNRKYM